MSILCVIYSFYYISDIMSTSPSQDAAAASSSVAARAAIMQYSRSSTSSSSTGCGSTENLPPRTLARLARQVRDAFKSPPEGVRLVVDNESGLPTNLGELMVSLSFNSLLFIKKKSRRLGSSWSMVGWVGVQIPTQRIQPQGSLARWKWAPLTNNIKFKR